jgi:hypothetical protein
MKTNNLNKGVEHLTAELSSMRDDLIKAGYEIPEDIEENFSPFDQKGHDAFKKRLTALTDRFTAVFTKP